MQSTPSGREEAQLAVARFLAVSAARNDAAYRVDATDANSCVRELRPESFGNRSVSNDPKHVPSFAIGLDASRKPKLRCYQRRPEQLFGFLTGASTIRWFRILPPKSPLHGR
jgi:hypothetical protein